MTPEQAAAVLGVSVDAPRAEFDAAYRRAARALHPDREGAEPTAFIQATEARRVLLELAEADAVAEAPVLVRRPPSIPLLVTWILLVLFAIAVSIGGSNLPLGPADPIIRFGLMLTGGIGFALTGKRVYFVLAVISIAATALVTILFTTFGALVGMLLLAAPLYGFLVMGRTRRLLSRP